MKNSLLHARSKSVVFDSRAPCARLKGGIRKTLRKLKQLQQTASKMGGWEGAGELGLPVEPLLSLLLFGFLPA